MERKFECKDCGHIFTSDDNSEVRCPQCGSDNVDYSHIHFPYKYFGYAICFLIAIYALLNIDYGSLFSRDDIAQGEADTIVADIINPSIDSLKRELEDLGIKIPPTIKGIDKIELNDDGSYNVNIRIDNPPEKDYVIVLTDVKTNQVVAKSKDGRFTDVPFSPNEGKYDAQIVSASTNEVLSEKTEITGFAKVEPISAGLSKSELQALINAQDPTLLGHDNKYLSPVYKIKYINLPKDAEFVPDNLSDVFEMLDYESWTSVEVTALEYDKTKHISSITLKINVPARQDF